MDETGTDVLESAGQVRACVFVLGGERLAIEVTSAREVVVLDECTRVPRAPAHLVGVANVRGRVMPILDIGPLLGLASPRIGRGTRALAIEASGFRAAIVIEELGGLASSPALVPFPAGARRRFGAFGVGTLEHEGARATMLDPARLLEALRTWDRIASRDMMQ